MKKIGVIGARISSIAQSIQKVIDEENIKIVATPDVIIGNEARDIKSTSDLGRDYSFQYKFYERLKTPPAIFYEKPKSKFHK